MANYKYRGISASGEAVNGVVEAPDKFEAVAKIKSTCPIVEEIEEVDVKQKGIAKRPKKIDAKNLSMLCSRFSIILGVGLPIVQAPAGQTVFKQILLSPCSKHKHCHCTKSGFRYFSIFLHNTEFSFLQCFFLLLISTAQKPKAWFLTHSRPQRHY